MSTFCGLLPLSVAAAAGLGLLVALSWALCRRHYALRHIPGPFLASITALWAAWRVFRGEYYMDIVAELHAKYGPVVRSGPHRVSFAGPDAIAEIYGTSQVYPKAASYGPMTVLANGQEVTTIITLRDEKRVTEIKRHISAGFSSSTWLKQEDQIDGTIDILLGQLHSKTGTTVPLNKWLSFWAFDTLTTLAFSETRGFLKAGTDLDNIFPSSRQRFGHWRHWALAPRLEALIYKNWLMQKFQKTSSTLAQLAMRRIQQRKAVDKNATGRDLLGRYLAASQAVPDVIGPRNVVALTISTIHAGSETVALNASGALSYALSNLPIFRKLESEILAAGLQPSMPLRFADVEKLPYLDALLRETLRFSINPNINERTITSSPSGGVTICDTFIPSGTDVAVSHWDVSRSQLVFGANTAAFDPERWLDVDEQTRREMDRASMGFSWGRRVCIGQHLARIEMKKLVASLMEPVRVGDRGGSFSGVNLDVKLTARAG
ncbi:Pisatin demethylase [Cercospora zeina]